MLRTVVVNLQSHSDHVLRGVLWGYRGGWLTLREVSILRESGQASPVLGEVVVDRRNVAWLQVLP